MILWPWLILTAVLSGSVSALVGGWCWRRRREDAEARAAELEAIVRDFHSHWLGAASLGVGSSAALHGTFKRAAGWVAVNPQGRAVTRAEALTIARDIGERAERARDEAARTDPDAWQGEEDL